MTFAVIMGAGGLAGAAVLPFVPAPAPESWPYIAASMAVQFVYYPVMYFAFRVGDLSVVYPLARGTAPALVAAGGAIFAGEALGWRAAAGVAVISAGIASLALSNWRAKGDPAAVAYALATGLTIGVYTTIDGIGVRLSGSPFGYLGWLFVVTGFPTLLWVLWRRARFRLAPVRPYLVRGGLAGLILITGYALVLWAFSFGALAPVAALRETSVIMAAALGALFLGEPFGRNRVIAAAIVAAGAVLLNLPLDW